MTHEIKTPISTIIGTTEMFAPERLAEDQRRLLGLIQKSGHHLHNLVTGILDFSQIKAGCLVLDKNATDPREIARDVLNMFRTSCDEKGVGLHLKVDKNVPQEIHTDKTRLQQILTNLVGNAVKFTQEGNVTLHLFLSAAAEHPQLAVEVSDTGRGMSQKEASRLFQAYSQASPDTASSYGGNGLGLALSKKIAQALDGDLVLSRTAPEEGSTFVATVDAPAPQTRLTTTPTNEDDANDLLKRPPEDKYPLAGFHILVAEDDESFREIASLALGSAGAEVTSVATGAEAYKQVKAASFDLILMDLQMPGMSGPEAVRHLRAFGISTSTVALSGHNLAQEKNRALGSGFDGYLEKTQGPYAVVRFVREYAQTRAILAESSPVEPLGAAVPVANQDIPIMP